RLDAKRALDSGLAGHSLGSWIPANSVEIDHRRYVLMVSRSPDVLLDGLAQEVEGDATEVARCQRFRSGKDFKRQEMRSQDLRHESLFGGPLAEHAQLDRHYRGPPPVMFISYSAPRSYSLSQSPSSFGPRRLKVDSP